MRNIHRHHIRPSEQEFHALWANATIILDTNVLLGLYRVSGTARDELLSTLSAFSHRLWLPHRVGVEFMRNRGAVQLSRAKSLRTFLAGQLKSFDDYCAKELRAVDPECSGIIRPVQDALKAALKHAEGLYSDSCANLPHDEILEHILALFDGRAAPPPSQAWLDQIFTDGAARYQEHQPPGHGDSKKTSDSDPHAKFGDLLIWREILEHDHQGRCFIFVTDDVKKDDWYLRTDGKTIGPLPFLRREALDAELDCWFYTSSQFLVRASEHLDRSASAGAVSELDRLPGLGERTQVATLQERGLEERLSLLEKLQQASLGVRAISHHDLVDSYQSMIENRGLNAALRVGISPLTDSAYDDAYVKSLAALLNDPPTGGNRSLIASLNASHRLAAFEAARRAYPPHMEVVRDLQHSGKGGGGSTHADAEEPIEDDAERNADDTDE